MTQRIPNRQRRGEGGTPVTEMQGLELGDRKRDGVSARRREHRAVASVSDEDIGRIAITKELNSVVRVATARQNTDWIFRPDQHLPEFPVREVRGLSGHERNSRGMNFRSFRLLCLPIGSTPSFGFGVAISAVRLGRRTGRCIRLQYGGVGLCAWSSRWPRC